MLSYPNDQEPFIVETDASGVALGGAVGQKDFVTNIVRPICYVSRALTSAERRYSTIEREALAVVYCIIRCRYLLMHRKIEVYTDLRPLLFIFKNSIPEGRLGRLTMKLQEYDIKFF